MYDHLSCQWMLDCETRNEAEDFLKINVNKKLLQQQQCHSRENKEDGNNVDALLKKLIDMSGIIISSFTYL